MNISATFIRKPIATGLLMAAILLLGLISYELLPVAALPNIDSPTVMVTAQLPGADAQTVASTVTTPLERQFRPNTRADANDLEQRQRKFHDYIAIRS
jgi:multidrug efflux pump subunit AcrB